MIIKNGEKKLVDKKICFKPHPLKCPQSRRPIILFMAHNMIVEIKAILREDFIKKKHKA